MKDIGQVLYGEGQARLKEIKGSYHTIFSTVQVQVQDRLSC